MTDRRRLEKEVLATIVQHLEAAKLEGRDPWDEVKRAFPDVPTGVQAAACLELDMQKEEAWWQGLERTIEVEVIRKAIGGPEGSGQ